MKNWELLKHEDRLLRKELIQQCVSLDGKKAALRVLVDYRRNMNVLFGITLTPLKPLKEISYAETDAEWYQELFDGRCGHQQQGRCHSEGQTKEIGYQAT